MKSRSQNELQENVKGSRDAQSRITLQIVSSERPRRVLIVEDDDDSRAMLGELVAAFGHQPFRAASGAEALVYAGQARLDVALIDIGLRGEDGCEVAKSLRAALGGNSIRLVALTGYSDGATREIADEAGFDDYIIKPVMPEALAALLQSTPAVG